VDRVYCEKDGSGGGYFSPNWEIDLCSNFVPETYYIIIFLEKHCGQQP